jgi:mono/diheme cytochrome c family protein
MRILAVIGALAIIVAIAAAVYLFGGFFSVAASEPEPEGGIVNWALTRIRMASVARHAPAGAPGDLDDPQTVRAGARAFAKAGCANCHGEPGPKAGEMGNWQKFSEAMNPDPPDLVKDIVPHREPGQLFWVIKNGIQMTGMPSFAKVVADDKEIWSVVAFLRKLPTVSEADYKAWTATP